MRADIAYLAVQAGYGVPEGVKNALGPFSKILGSVAGILLVVTILKWTFYIVKVGERGVLMRRGLPVPKRNGEFCLSLAKWCINRPLFPLYIVLVTIGSWRKNRQVGFYKVKRPGIWVKFPGWYDVEKVNVQKRVQKLPPFTVDCRDGQRIFDIDLVTRVPCDDDGPEFADHPARKIISSSEADDVFESFCGMALVSGFELAQKSERDNQLWLLNHVNNEAGTEIDRVGYILERINQRSRSYTGIQVAVNAFGPQPPDNQSEQATGTDNESDNIRSLPHSIVVAAALGKDLETP